MTTPPTPYLLDTNVLLALIRGGDLGMYIDTTFQLRAQPERPLVCVVSVGEIWTLAARNGWGPPKQAALSTMLQSLVVVDINNPLVLKAYVDVELATDKAGRVMGKNDVWIAAVASVTRAHVLTTDRDFDHLVGSLLQGTYIDPGSKLPPTTGGPQPAVK